MLTQCGTGIVTMHYYTASRPAPRKALHDAHKGRFGDPVYALNSCGFILSSSPWCAWQYYICCVRVQGVVVELRRGDVPVLRAAHEKGASVVPRLAASSSTWSSVGTGAVEDDGTGHKLGDYTSANYTNVNAVHINLSAMI